MTLHSPALCRALLALVIACAASACGAAPIVAIREKNFRVCGDPAACDNPLALPLAADARKRVEDFLKAGGVNDDVGIVSRAPDAPLHYKALLDALARPSLDASMLGQPPFSAYFGSQTPARETIDARREDAIPPGSEPYVVHDDRYDWVFYPVPGKPAALGSLLIMRRYGVKPKD